jgi:translation initiation factor 1A
VFFWAKNLNQREPQSKVRLPQEELGEVFGITEHMLGANRVEVRSIDGKTRMGRIPGKMKKRVWLRAGDVVVLVPWAFQDDKADIVWRYQGTKLNG